MAYCHWLARRKKLPGRWPNIWLLGLKIATSPTMKRIAAMKMKNRPIPALACGASAGLEPLNRTLPKGRRPSRFSQGTPGYRSSMTRMFHVSSTLNRASIQTYGLDWTRMSATPGIAGSRRPEVEGVFLSPDHFTATFFVRINNTGGPVDIWAVDNVDPVDLIEAGSGYSYVPYRIDPHQLVLQDEKLTEEDLPSLPTVHSGSSTAYSSGLTITLDDGTELRGDDAHALLARRPMPDDQ